MKKLLAIFSTVLLTAFAVRATDTYAAEARCLPNSVFSGYQGKHHVQGIAVDKEKGHVYFSFTTRLVKTDFEGRLLASLDGLTGHLGCLAFNPDDNKLYASIEYKNDIIGVGIAGDEAKKRDSRFYIAIFDTDRFNEPDMTCTDGLMDTVPIPQVALDYHAKVMNNGIECDHRYGCSGIDGVAFAPDVKDKDKNVLYVAYGTYSDTTRTDNDHQVLLCYEPESRKVTDRYFVYTGNTSWGIQNLCYNETENALMAAVYKGRKKGYPNFSLFAIDLGTPPVQNALKGFDNGETQKTLRLKNTGIHDEKTGISGWHFAFGATGLCAVGNGLYYISHPSSKPEQSTTIHLHRWTGNPDNPFEQASVRNH